MKTLILSLSFLIIATASPAFASDQNACRSEEGKIELIKEYVKEGGVVPACGRDCARNFILQQVCADTEVKESCFTEAGQNLKIRAFAAANPVPACGRECARTYVLSKVCPKPKATVSAAAFGAERAEESQLNSEENQSTDAR